MRVANKHTNGVGCPICTVPVQFIYLNCSLLWLYYCTINVIIVRLMVHDRSQLCWPIMQKLALKNGGWHLMGGG